MLVLNADSVSFTTLFHTIGLPDETVGLVVKDTLNALLSVKDEFAEEDRLSK